jgi:hypothetical protein
MIIFRCVCDPGYELSGNGRNCVDIDECRSSPCQSGVCTNTDGGFKCECPVGFRFESSSVIPGFKAKATVAGQ